MKRNLATRFALILGVSILALSLVAGVAYAASAGIKDRARDKTKSQVCDGSCKTGSTCVAGSGSQTKSQNRSQARAQTQTQVCDGTCQGSTGTATKTRTQTRDRTNSQSCDGTCKVK